MASPNPLSRSQLKAFFSLMLLGVFASNMALSSVAFAEDFTDTDLPDFIIEDVYLTEGTSSTVAATASDFIGGGYDATLFSLRIVVTNDGSNVDVVDNGVTATLCDTACTDSSHWIHNYSYPSSSTLFSLGSTIHTIAGSDLGGTSAIETFQYCIDTNGVVLEKDDNNNCLAFANPFYVAPISTDDDADDDSDGLSNTAEAAAGTDPLVADTDDDCTSDGDEVTDGTDPLDAMDGYSCDSSSSVGRADMDITDVMVDETTGEISYIAANLGDLTVDVNSDVDADTDIYVDWDGVSGPDYQYDWLDEINAGNWMGAFLLAGGSEAIDSGVILTAGEHTVMVCIYPAVYSGDSASGEENCETESFTVGSSSGSDDVEDSDFVIKDVYLTENGSGGATLVYFTSGGYDPDDYALTVVVKNDGDTFSLVDLDVEMSELVGDLCDTTCTDDTSILVTHSADHFMGAESLLSAGGAANDNFMASDLGDISSIASLQYCVDTASLVPEQYETNNCITFANPFYVAPVEETAGLPDLVAANLAITDLFNGTYEITVDLSNVGTFSVDPALFPGHTTASLNGVPYASYAWNDLGSEFLGFLIAGGAVTLNPYGAYPSLTNEDVLEVCVDSGDLVEESNPDNNCVSVVFDDDIDDDGLSNEAELSAGTDSNDSDSDDDELSDGDEVNTYGTDPLDSDTDDDELSDSFELTTSHSDPLVPDSEPVALPFSVEAGNDQAVGFGNVFSLDDDAYAANLSSDLLTVATIDWGDTGTGATETATQALSTDRIYLQGSHLYAAPGTYTLKVCASDGVSATLCDSFSLSVVGNSSSGGSSGGGSSGGSSGGGSTGSSDEDEEDVVLTSDDEEPIEGELADDADAELTCTSPFTDTIGHWAEKTICLIAEQGVVHGKSEGIFDPNANITRAELLKMILLNAGVTVPDTTATSPFLDVAPTDWYYKYVMYGNELGVGLGYGDGTFKPNEAVNRAEALVMLLRMAGAASETSSSALSFSDLLSSDWFYDEVGLGVDYGLVEGYENGTFQPAAPITRAEAATIIRRAWYVWY